MPLVAIQSIYCSTKNYKGSYVIIPRAKDLFFKLDICRENDYVGSYHTIGTSFPPSFYRIGPPAVTPKYIRRRVFPR